MRLGTFVLALNISSCLGPSTSETPIELTDAQWGDYWLQLERRWSVFFEKQCVEVPGLPGMDDVRARVQFFEVPHEWLKTCTYNRNSYKIRIGDDKWDSGCVPHELGHAACHLLGVKICIDFEHNNYESRCVNETRN